MTSAQVILQAAVGRVSSFGQLLPPPALSNTSIANTTEIGKRFVKVSQENIFAIKEKRFEEKTAKSTKWGITRSGPP